MRLLGQDTGNFSENIRMLLTEGLTYSRQTKTTDIIPRSTSLTVISNYLLTLSLNKEIEMSQSEISLFPIFNFLFSFILIDFSF